MPDLALAATAVAAAPETYTVPNAQEIILKSARAHFDGTSAAGSYVPTIKILAPGGLVVAECPIATSLAAGALADVSWFPGVAAKAAGPVGTNAQIRAPVLDTPDASGNVYPSLSTSNGFTNVRRLLPYYAHGGSGSWVGTIRVPADYASNPQLIVTAVTVATTGAVRWIAGTAVVAAGVSEDTAFTNETAQNVTVPGVALQRFDTTFSISTAVAAGVDLNVIVTRDGGNAGDTCTSVVAVWAVTLTYKT